MDPDLSPDQPGLICGKTCSFRLLQIQINAGHDLCRSRSSFQNGLDLQVQIRITHRSIRAQPYGILSAVGKHLRHVSGPNLIECTLLWSWSMTSQDRS